MSDDIAKSRPVNTRYVTEHLLPELVRATKHHVSLTVAPLRAELDNAARRIEELQAEVASLKQERGE